MPVHATSRGLVWMAYTQCIIRFAHLYLCICACAVAYWIIPAVMYLKTHHVFNSCHQWLFFPSLFVWMFKCSSFPFFFFIVAALFIFSLDDHFFFSFWQFDEAVTPETFCRNRTLTPSEVSPQMLNSSFWKKKKKVRRSTDFRCSQHSFLGWQENSSNLDPLNRCLY